MRVNTSRHTVKHLAGDARVTGATRTEFVGDGPTKCSRPVELHMFGYPDKISVAVLGTEPDRAVAQWVHVRCRKCPECLKHRARLWTARAIDETKKSNRTWFGTLTLTPERQTWARYSALANLRRRVSDVTEDSVFEESVNVIGREITLFLKRLRKVAPFRYLLVTEVHKSGLPHFHMLIHEYAGSISKRKLEDQWSIGFSHWRLVDVGNEQACGYVCKYLSKSAQTRVRGSQNYGQGINPLLTERLLGATREMSSTIEALERRKTDCQKQIGSPPLDE